MCRIYKTSYVESPKGSGNYINMPLCQPGVQAEKDLSVRTCFELHNRHAAPAYGKKVLGKWHPLLDFLVLIPWGLMISYDPLGALLPTDGSAVASTSDSVVELD